MKEHKRTMHPNEYAQEKELEAMQIELKRKEAKEIMDRKFNDEENEFLSRKQAVLDHLGQEDSGIYGRRRDLVEDEKQKMLLASMNK